MMSVPLHDIIPSRRLWTAAARRRFNKQTGKGKAVSSDRTPKDCLSAVRQRRFIHAHDGYYFIETA
jgi:hypothetical protein